MDATATPDNHDVRESLLAIGQQTMAAKGFSAVGLKEILASAGVPKGSFYHYFASKDAYGEALLEKYFTDYLAEMDATLHQPGLTMAQRLMHYWQAWQDNQSVSDCQGKCLAVKLGAEVADLSESMRLTMQRGTTGIVDRLALAIKAGAAEGSLSIEGQHRDVAQSLYQLWLGASVLVKVTRTTAPFDSAMNTTRQILHIAP
ncbi:TetR/AcrR family transcriptional regulator [Pseudoxanthomonas sp. JBR18]|uniref:TetR/AcrR family transcriptional regulator n=1 Tax=Pseudoxanthomonas sp. JBR18 TaxID=2969308 RepID=UPI002306852A|nr:TetR/AcrR family transcriptional regulator [Pseudoxanthomonas sp. JBR18]WCE05693.1 TetR/AcrR family transcriptional regulator [Pseudoxanthomonas sp. JBR18]